MVVRKDNYFLLSVLSFFLFSFWGCSYGEKWDDMQSTQVENEIISVLSEKEDSIGRANAVKKAYQLTDLQFTPKNKIEHNEGFFLPNITYKGMIYSSVKELETYVGYNVSFHTFMTALNNPRSKIYTERINTNPYHGINCKAYYGTVCSELVSYALGLKTPSYNSYDYEQSELMEALEDVIPEKLKIADVLWRKGHVAIITDIVKGDNGIVSKIEICEAMSPYCKRYYVSREYFAETIMSNFQRIYRYKEIGKNNEYTSINEFVAVEGEERLSFTYNNDICVDKGDCSNYLESEEVIINILNTEAKTIEIYKDDILFLQLTIDNRIDYVLNNLTYGDYKARIIIDNKGSYSDFIYWKVVNADVKFDKMTSRLFVKSNNAIPNYVISCTLNGLCSPLSEGSYHVFSKEEQSQGYIDIPCANLTSSYPYLKVYFQTDYGRIIQKPLKWY